MRSAHGLSAAAEAVAKSRQRLLPLVVPVDMADSGALMHWSFREPSLLEFKLEAVVLVQILGEPMDRQARPRSLLDSRLLVAVVALEALA